MKKKLIVICSFALLSSSAWAVSLSIPQRPSSFPLPNPTRPINYGAVIAWGDNSNGQTNVPSSLTNVVQVASGLFHAAALNADGTVVCWGFNYSGQTTTPQNATNIVQISAGYSHTVAQKNDGTLVAWGDDSSGQIDIPAGLSNVVSVAAGNNFSLALKNDGSVVILGGDIYQYGGKYNYIQNSPLNLTNIVQIAAGKNYALALKNDGTIIGWGDTFQSLSAMPIPSGLSNVVQIAAGDENAAILKSNGTVVDWGAGAYQLTAGLKAVQVSSGRDFTAALIANGTVVSTTNYGLNQIPAGIGKIFQISAGYNFIAAIMNGPQNIDFPALSPITFGSSPVTLNAKAASGLAISYYSSNTNIASIMDNVMTIIGAGTTTITASQSGNTNWNPASVSNTLIVNKSSNVIGNLPVISNLSDSNTTVSAATPSASSGLPVAVTIKSGPAYISNNIIHTTSYGTVVVAANQPGNSNYLPAQEVTTSFTVGPPGFQVIAPFARIANQSYEGNPSVNSDQLLIITPPVSSVGLPVTVSVKSGPASIAGNTVTIYGFGTVVLAANQSGNAIHPAAPEVTTSFLVVT